MRSARIAALLAGLWAGVQLCIGLIATPAPFATLPLAEAGQVVGRIFAQEAYLSLGVALLLLVIEKRRGLDIGSPVLALTTEIMLLLGTIFCTVAGYFAVQPMMAAARVGQGSWSFGALHAISLGFFAVKGLLVLALAWRQIARTQLVQEAGTRQLT